MRLARWSLLGVLSCAGRAHPPAAPVARTSPIRRDTRGAVALVAGASHSCALLHDATVRCWGWNRDGRLGDPNLPAQFGAASPQGLRDVVALAAGDDHTCAAHRDGHVSCWGSDAGRSEQGSAHSDVPVAIDGLRDVVSL